MDKVNKAVKDEDSVKKSLHFIEEIIEEDIRNQKNGGRIHTRFPPEPNGYLHIGHAKAICLSYGIAEKYNGVYNLRFDDTNPELEDTEYVEAIEEDVKWLGFDWQENKFFASDYFDKLFEWAIKLIKDGKAYVCDLSQEEMSHLRGTPTIPSQPSPYRNRSIEENLDLFQRMKKGEFQNGERVLRAKIDLASPNMHMRDPAIYRIKHMEHHRTGNDWCIYPTYDFTHGQSDYLEGITHSLCSLEFENHRPLYDWFLDQLIDTEYRPRQIEFARLNLNYTIMSKRGLRRLVQEGYVSGWDDPRLPTISGLRRRGYTPDSIRVFADKVGIAKRENIIDLSLLEFCVREDLNRKALRLMGVLDPLKVVITNYPEGQSEELDAVNNPEDESAGTRKVPFSKVLYIEQADFMEDAPKKFFRLSVGREVRLRYAYYITCQEIVKDADGNIVELRCTYDPETKGGQSADNRKIKATLHWVSAEHAIEAEARLYDRLFVKEEPGYNEEDPEDKDFTKDINPESLKVTSCYVEPFAKDLVPGTKCQFERLAYFCVDPDSTPEKQVFNRTVTLKDAWAKIQKR